MATTDAHAAPAGGRSIFWFAALAGVLLVLLHESLFFGKGLVAADAVLRFRPWSQKARPSNVELADQYAVFVPTEEFVHQQKSFPLWNPSLCCGMPNLGSIQGAMLFPIRLLLSPLDPFAASGPSAFIKLCLAGWFTLMYLRLLGVSHAAAFLAGLAFSLSGFMIVWLGHPLVNSAMWLPLLLCFVEASFQDESGHAAAAPAIRAWAGFAVAFAFMILGGHPPTAIHVTMVVVMYFLFRLMEPGRQRFRRAGLLAGALMVGLLLAAPQILPYLEYYNQSSSPQASAALGRWSSHLSPATLIHFLLPNAMGNPALGYYDMAHLLGWSKADPFSERTGYVGIVPLFLAACAMALRRCRFTKFYACLALGSMLVIYGLPPLPALMKALPVLRDMNQTRLLLVAGFSMAVLAGLGWDELWRMRARRGMRIGTVAFCAVVGLALFWFWYVTGPKIHALEASHWAFLRGQFLILGVGLAVTILLALWPAHWNRRVAMAIGLGWTACDLLCFGIGYNPSITRDRYYPRTPAIEWLQQEGSLFRVFAGGPILIPNTAEVFGLSDARGCDFMAVRRYEELISGQAGTFFFYQRASEIPKAFPLLNVKYILSATDLPHSPQKLDLVYSNELLIYRYKECRDRALLVYDYQVEPDKTAALEHVTAEGFDPRRVLVLEEQPAAANKANGGRTAGTNAAESVRILSYGPDDVRIQASLPRPGYLLLLDTYFPGWKATVNGQAAPIHRADYNFRAVSLPAGASTVEFSYRPMSLRIGLALCAGGLLALGVAGILTWRREN